MRVAWRPGTRVAFGERRHAARRRRTLTSQSCSSCPPADALLGELAGRGDVVALGFHISYWDGLAGRTSCRAGAPPTGSEPTLGFSVFAAWVGAGACQRGARRWKSVFAQHLSCGSNVAMRSTVTALSIVSTASYRPVADGVGGPRDEVFHITAPSPWTGSNFGFRNHPGYLPNRNRTAGFAPLRSFAQLKSPKLRAPIFLGCSLTRVTSWVG